MLRIRVPLWGGQLQETHTNLELQTDLANKTPKPLFRFTRHRLAELALGHTVNQGLIWFFDYLLYPAAIAWLGLWRGGAIMALVSLVVCIGMLRFYGWSKRDWLGIEAVKSLKTYDGESRFGRWMAWLMRRGDPVACVVLSIRFDPFITTEYMRQGAFNGMSRRDWRIFLSSWFISNAWWSLFCYAGVTSIAGLWQWFRSM